MINGKQIQTHRCPFCTAKPNADLCMCVDLKIGQKTVENQDWAPGPLQAAATWPSGHRAVAGHGAASSKTKQLAQQSRAT